MKRVSPFSIGVFNKIEMKKRTEKLKTTFKNVINYLRSDSYMYSSLLSDKPSHCFPVADTTIHKASRGGRKKIKFRHQIAKYLKSDCYMYSPLVACSTNVSAAPENNGALKITQPSKRPGKRRYKKNSSPRSTLVRNTLAFRREEEKCLSNPVGRSSLPTGGSSKGSRIPKTTTIWTREELFKDYQYRF